MALLPCQQVADLREELDVGGGAAAAGFSVSSRRRSEFTARTIRKMIQARIRKLMRTVRKWP